MVFVDREAAYPHKYKIIPDDGGEPYYVILERADEPLTPGTPLNAETFNNLVNAFEKLHDNNALAIQSHADNKENPHNVTLVQLGVNATAEELNYLSGYNLPEQLETMENSFRGYLEAHTVDTGNPHQVTAEQVGAAPANYADNLVEGFYDKDALGKTLDEIIDGVLSEMPNDSVRHISVMSGGRHSITIHKHASGYVSVEDITYASGVGYDTFYYRRCRSQYNDVWQEWEYDNPPMVVGVEYRTTERYEGKAVYVRLYDAKTLPSTGMKDVDLPVQAPKVISTECFAVNTANNSRYSFPIITANGTILAVQWCVNPILRFYVFGDCSAYHAYAVVRYTKY